MHLSSLDARIYIAGHRGLLGQAILKRCQRAGYNNLIVRTSAQLDLRDQSAVENFMATERPEYVVLAAARVGGILANDTYPADFITDNLLIQNNVLHAAASHRVKRLVFLGSTCIYPREAPQPIQETALLSGPLEETNKWYAVAKIAGVTQCQAMRKQHGCDYVSLMATNLYGPGDNFDLETSHVLPALLRKFHEAQVNRSSSVTIWGTGTPKREFLYSEDMADACVFALQVPEEKLYSVAPDGLLNVGTGEDISINELCRLLKDLVGFSGRIVHDRSKPDGTPRKLVDVSRMKALGWQATTPLERGIAQTYAWYRKTPDAL